MTHRTYMGANIQLRVYDNHLSIWNEGTLPYGLSLEDLKKEHSSRPRNPVLANACFLGGYIDSWGRGTLKIINSCKDAGLREPEIVEMNGGLSVTLFTLGAVSYVGKELGEKLGEKLGENEIKVLNLLRVNKKATIVSIAEEVGLSATGVEKIIARLKNKELIQRIGSAKGGYWKVIETT